MNLSIFLVKASTYSFFVIPPPTWICMARSWFSLYWEKEAQTVWIQQLLNMYIRIRPEWRLLCEPTFFHTALMSPDCTGKAWPLKLSSLPWWRRHIGNCEFQLTLLKTVRDLAPAKSEKTTREFCDCTVLYHMMSQRWLWGMHLIHLLSFLIGTGSVLRFWLLAFLRDQ